MAVKAVFITLAVVCVAGLASASSLDFDNLRSTMSIVRKTCYYPKVKSEEVAQQFVDCYDEAPGKEQFFTCQREVFNGVLFDTVDNIKANCAHPLKLPAYASCIEREMNKAGIDQNDAIRKLNACQLAVF